MVKDVDYLPMATPVVHLNHSGIRRDCAALFKLAGLLVVLTERRDLCPSDTES